MLGQLEKEPKMLQEDLILVTRKVEDNSEIQRMVKKRNGILYGS